MSGLEQILKRANSINLSGFDLKRSSDIFDSILEQARSEKVKWKRPWFVIKYGPPGSGKSTVMKSVYTQELKWTEDRIQKMVHVDIDALVEGYTDFEQEAKRFMREVGGPSQDQAITRRYFERRKVMDLLNNQILLAALVAGRDIDIETTGNDVTWLVSFVEFLHVALPSYQTAVVYPFVSPEVLQKRLVLRNKNQIRQVNIPYALSVAKNAAVNFPTIAKACDLALIIDNSQPAQDLHGESFPLLLKTVDGYCDFTACNKWPKFFLEKNVFKRYLESTFNDLESEVRVSVLSYVFDWLDFRDFTLITSIIRDFPEDEIGTSIRLVSDSDTCPDYIQAMVFDILCNKGAFATIEWLLDRRGFRPRVVARIGDPLSLFSHLCAQGKLEAAQLVTQLFFTSSSIQENIFSLWYLEKDDYLSLQEYYCPWVPEDPEEDKKQYPLWKKEEEQEEEEDKKTLLRGPLFEALSNGHLPVAKWLLSEFAKEESCGNGFWSVTFVHTCANGHVEAAKWLLNCITSSTSFLQHTVSTGLQQAIEGGHLPLVKWLTTTITIQAQNLDVQFLLRKACTLGDLELVKLVVDLFQITEDLEAKAISNACKGGHLVVADYLWEKLSFPKSKFAWDPTIFIRCYGQGHDHIIQWLLAQRSQSFSLYYRIPDYLQTTSVLTGAFVSACLHGNLHIAQSLLKTGSVKLVPHSSSSSWTPWYQGYSFTLLFHLVCQDGQLEIAQWLLSDPAFQRDQKNDKLMAQKVADIKATFRPHSSAAFLRFDTFTTVCSLGHLAVAKWLFSLMKDGLPRYILQRYLDTVFEFALEVRRVDICLWLSTLFDISADQSRRLFILSCKRQKLEAAQALAIHADQASIEESLSDACNSGRYLMIDWLIRTFDCSASMLKENLLKARKYKQVLTHVLTQLMQWIEKKDRRLLEGDLDEGDLDEEGDLIEGNLIERDLVEGDLVERDLVERDLVERDLIERD